jgi:two-component system alkaline phosphatase synthesis response regulator PhoP
MCAQRAREAVIAKKVLVVEDDEAMAELLSGILADEGYETRCAFDGTDGLDQVAAFRPDLIVLDLMLPGINGYQVCQAVRKESGAQGPRIVVVSAKNHPVDRKQAARLGVDIYLSKPFEAAVLVSAVRDLIGLA